MQVEFLGFPGSGKSTIYKHALRWLEVELGRPAGARDALYRALLTQRRSFGWGARLGHLLPYKKRRNRLVHHFKRSSVPLMALNRFLAEHTALGGAIFKILNEPHWSVEDKRTVCRWLFSLFAQYQIIQEHTGLDDMVVWDEAFCHRVVTLFGYDKGAVGSREIAAYVHLIPRPGAVFLVECSPEVCEKRLGARSYPHRLARMDQTGRSEFFEHCLDCIQAAVQSLESLGVWIYRLDNSGPLEETKQLLTQRLHKFMRAYRYQTERSISETPPENSCLS